MRYFGLEEGFAVLREQFESLEHGSHRLVRGGFSDRYAVFSQALKPSLRLWYDVAHQRGLLVLVSPDQSDILTNEGVAGQMRIDLAKLDAEATNFHLAVNSAGAFDRSISTIPAKITAFVNPIPGSLEIRHPGFRGGLNNRLELLNPLLWIHKPVGQELGAVEIASVLVISKVLETAVSISIRLRYRSPQTAYRFSETAARRYSSPCSPMLQILLRFSRSTTRS